MLLCATSSIISARAKGQVIWAVLKHCKSCKQLLMHQLVFPTLVHPAYGLDLPLPMAADTRPGF